MVSQNQIFFSQYVNTFKHNLNNTGQCISWNSPHTEIFKSDWSPGETGDIYILGSYSFWEMKVPLVPLQLLGLKEKDAGVHYDLGWGIF